MQRDPHPLVPFARLALSMRLVKTFTTLTACVLLLALSAPSVWANAADDRIINDCANSPTGALTGRYPAEQLKHALRNLPGDFREYSGCPDAIRQALLAAAGAGGGSGGSGGDGSDLGGGSDGGGNGGDSATGGPLTGGTDAGGLPPSVPAPAGAERPLDVAGTAIAPGTLPEIGRDSHRLPTPLLVLLVLLGVAALVPAALTIGRRAVGHRDP